jgi:bacillithiol biosynthesis deacetylase BshB1
MRIMAVGAHPDDVELSCGGSVAKLVSLGHEVGIVDLTCGEMGSSGSEKTRIAESMRSARILGVSWRVCCGLPDSRLNHADISQVYAFVKLLRRHRPALVLGPWGKSRHPDHAETGEIVGRGIFLAGLWRIPVKGRPFSGTKLLYYMGDTQFEPTIIVDVGKFFKKKMRAIEAYKSQFDRRRPDSSPTRLNQPGFLGLIEARASYIGRTIGVRYGEGFLHEGPLEVGDPAALMVQGNRDR